MLVTDDKDEKDSRTPPREGKLLKRFLIGSLIILVVLFLWVVLIHVEVARQGITAGSSFVPILSILRENIILYIEKKQGIDENYVITNEKEFLSGLKETVYKPLTRAMNMKKCFEAGVFKILIKDNVCYIYTDLTTATQYLSGKPLILRKDITYVVTFLVQRHWREGASLNVLQRGGYFHGYGLFLGKPDLTYLTLFTREMNDLYHPVCVFRNTPPISLVEIP